MEGNDNQEHYGGTIRYEHGTNLMREKDETTESQTEYIAGNLEKESKKQWTKVLESLLRAFSKWTHQTIKSNHYEVTTQIKSLL